MNILIIGFGRAGKRHAKILNSMGITTGLFDVNGIKYDDVDAIYGEQRPPIYQDFDKAMLSGIWDIAVIATPPNTHLSYIEACLYWGMSISCEKPLSGFGEIANAQRLMWNKEIDITNVQVQYNYRFNPDIQIFNPKYKSHAWQMVATQHRPELPIWGTLLDHISHAADMIRWTSKSNFEITESTHYIYGNEKDVYQVHGVMPDGTPVYMLDEVYLLDKNRPRISRLISPNGYFDATPNSQMFVKMWESFFENYRLGLPQYPGFEDALETQKILQDAFEKTKVITLSESE